MTRRRKPPKPQGINIEVPGFAPPVECLPGDKVYFIGTSTGPQVSRIERDGAQIWPEKRAPSSEVETTPK